MIDRIVRISHPGPLESFTWKPGATSLEDFRRYNLIYGWNGSGKTTISRILRALETGDLPKDCRAEIAVDGRRIQDSDFRSEAVAIRVFNSDFVTDSVLTVDSDGVAPIFVLGVQSAKQQEQVQSLKQRHEQVAALLKDRKKQQMTVVDTLDKHRVDKAKEIKESLRSATSSRYNNYDKSNYRSRVEEMLKKGDAELLRLSLVERDKLRARCHEVPKPSIETVSYELAVIQEFVEFADRILQMTVVSEAIQSLQDDSTLSDWILDGVRIHRSRNSEQCFFCDQSLSLDRLERLQAHFNAEYENFLTRIDDAIASLRTESQAIDAISLPNRSQFYDSLTKDYERILDELKRSLGATKEFLDAVARELSEKKARAFESYSVTNRDALVDTSIVANLNDLIRDHNKMCTDFSVRVDEARARLEDDAVAGYLESYLQLQIRAEACEREVADLDKQVRVLAAGIARGEQKIRDHRRPAEELNEELHRYLGHGEIQFNVKKTGYEVVRGGFPASSLSEGEKTAIALLYFLKSLEDLSFASSKGIVVLDDPVSSLDANALYAAFGFIRERTKSAAQLIVLTHNFTFFREVKRWFNGKSRRAKSRMFMLDLELKDGRRCSILRELDPLLKDYESDYHYLFSRIYWHVHGGSGNELGENYVLPNMARRLLERFLAFRWPQQPGSGSLDAQLESVSLDSMSKVRIARFVNSYSHSDSIDESEHDPYVLGEAQHVLADLLDLIQLEDPVHYERMVALVKKSAKSA